VSDTVVLDVLGRYRSSYGEYEAGQEIHCASAEEADRLLRDSPGSFRRRGTPPPTPTPTPEPARSPVGDTDVEAFDRRARGGRKRASATKKKAPAKK
jgi:hypothetical protein